MTISRRTFLAAAAAGTASAALPAFTEQAAATATDDGFLPYTPDAFYRSSAVGLPVDAARTQQFQTFMTTFPDQKPWAMHKINGLPGQPGSAWGTSYAEATDADPGVVWKLTGTMNAKCASLKTTGFHAPANFGARLTGTSDSPFCVIDRVSGFTVFGTKAKQVGTNLITVGSAGLTYHSSNGLNGTNPRTTDKRNFTSRGRISDAMVIRRARVDAAIAAGTGLGHVLHMFIAETDTGFCHPMTGDEGNRNGFGAEGERIAIRPDVNLAARGLTPFGLAVARTLQEHGCYIGDNAGGASTLKAEQSSSTYQPWAGLTVTQNALKGVTWADFHVIVKGAQ